MREAMANPGGTKAALLLCSGENSVPIVTDSKCADSFTIMPTPGGTPPMGLHPS
jgi:hypothetical protein